MVVWLGASRGREGVLSHGGCSWDPTWDHYGISAMCCQRCCQLQKQHLVGRLSVLQASGFGAGESPE